MNVYKYHLQYHSKRNDFAHKNLLQKEYSAKCAALIMKLPALLIAAQHGL